MNQRDKAYFKERAARMELRALAAGGIKEPKPELLRESGEFLLQPYRARDFCLLG
jgi:hypothetical protein